MRCKLQGHNQDDYRVLHPKLLKEQEKHKEAPSKQQHDQSRGNRGVVISKWNPTNRFFTKKKGEYISDKAVEVNGKATEISNVINTKTLLRC